MKFWQVFVIEEMFACVSLADVFPCALEVHAYHHQAVDSNHETSWILWRTIAPYNTSWWFQPDARQILIISPIFGVKINKKLEPPTVEYVHITTYTCYILAICCSGYTPKGCFFCPTVSSADSSASGSCFQQLENCRMRKWWGWV